MIKLLITFTLFAGLVYYYNLDLIALIDKSGAPEWLAKKGYNVKNNTATVASSNIASSTGK